MRRLLLTVSTLVILTAGLLAGTAASVLAASGPASPYIVVFKDNTDTDAQTNRLQGDFGFAATFRYSHALRGFAARLTAGQVAAISRLPFVQFVGDDRTVSIADTANLAAGETIPTGVRRIGAATSVVVHTASTVAVAIIDTGEQLDNPDLNVVSGKNCVNTALTANDDNGHGTHVAGTIGGRNNGSTVPGVAAGTTIYAVKVLNSAGSGSFSQIACGIDWVRQNASTLNIKVASMSLGGGGSNDGNCGHSNFDTMHVAICNATAAGVTFVVAAGNSNANFAGSVPAAYPEVLTVTAVSDSDGQQGGTGGPPTCRTGEVDDSAATFSSFAVNATEINHTIAGPGVCILSDWPTNSTNTISGTSMATPHLSGAVALCLGQNGNSGPCTGMTPAQIITKMRSDAAARASAAPGYGFNGDPQHPISGRYYGNLVWVGGDLPAGGPTTGTLTGKVTNANTAAAISGATVSIQGGASTTTNGSGNYTFSNVTPGNYTVTASASGFTSSTMNNVSVSAGNTTTRNFPLAPTAPTTGTLTGKVTNASTAAAISGATVSIQGGASTTTNGSGNYTFSNVSPGNYTVTASAGGFTSSTVNGIPVTAGNTTTQNFALTPTGGGGPSAPGAPTLSAAGRGFQHGINLTITPGATNGSQLTGYQIYRSTASGGTYTQIASVGVVTTYTDTGNPTFRTSYYKVIAVNGVGPGPFSNVASAFSF